MPRKNTRAIGAQPWPKRPKRRPLDVSPAEWVRPGAPCWYESSPSIKYPAVISGQPWQLGDGTWVVRLTNLPAEYVAATGRDIVFSAGLFALTPRKADFAIYVGVKERVVVGTVGRLNATILDCTPPHDNFGMIYGETDPVPEPDVRLLGEQWGVPASMLADTAESRLMAAKAQLKIATDALERILGLDDYDTKVSKVADDALDEIRKT